VLAAILDDKGHEVLEIDANASVLVIDRGEVAGILTERDYLRRVTLEGRAEEDTAVREITSARMWVQYWRRSGDS
jgi:CBS domain-containing protein